MPHDSNRRGWMPAGFAAVAILCAAALLSFVLAMHCFPGGYNPAMRMLSALGRTEVRLVEWPWSHYLFMAGMFFSALAVMSAARRAGLSKWGAALNVAGLLWIAFVPENVNQILHDAGCWLVAAGGGVMLFSWRRAESARRVRRGWTIALVLPIAAMALALDLHALNVVPFAPLVTTLQKIVIFSFAAWLLCLSAKNAGRRARIAGAVSLGAPLILATFLFLRPDDCPKGGLLKDADSGGTPSIQDAADAPRVLPLSDDEFAALAWLEHVTGPLGAEEERELWDIGGTQHGIFAKRYNIAFAGYAAAAIGLIDVTVEQMRKGPNGGVTCEPGLMFFACNSHPHVALSVFSKLGYGDWSADAARWEKWALAHYTSPLFGGGEVNLVYHVRGNFMYPRGQDALDGWTLLWYEAWASDRRVATALWRKARDRLDWSRLDPAGDGTGSMGCCDPRPVSASVASVFLAAASRACGDAETAERLERAVDAKYLRREGGLFWLDLNREWRIGATAMRIISLAESRGSRFREMKTVD